VSPGALELCAGADLVIHDAQYTPAEFARKSTWGHCTVEYAVRVAHQAGAKRLALFHHDPLRDDEALDELARDAKELGACLDLEVMVAAEGLTVTL
jgi:ribonuclease BN (tRNA processing enzyme)